jgi:hypothetical protein
MPATDIANILSRLTTKPYITQEVIWGSGEPIQPSEYVGNGELRWFVINFMLMNVSQVMCKSMLHIEQK